MFKLICQEKLKFASVQVYEFFTESLKSSNFRKKQPVNLPILEGRLKSGQGDEEKEVGDGALPSPSVGVQRGVGVAPHYRAPSSP